MGRKMNFFLSALLVLLFGMELSTCSYATSTDLTDIQAQYVFRYALTNYYDFNNYFYYNFNASNITENLLRYNDYTNGWQNFQTYFNTYNEIDISDNNTIFFVRFYAKDSCTIYWWNFNNSKGSNDLPYLYFRFDKNTNLATIYAIENNQSTTSTNIIGGAVSCVYTNDTWNFSGFRNNVNISNGTSSIYSEDIGTSIGGFNCYLNINSDWANGNTSSVINPIPGLISFSSTNSIYTNYNGSTFESPIPVLLKTLYDNGNTGGDTGGGDTGGGDTGGGGTTTPDYKEDLNNINNSINNQGQAIIENQNQNNEEIKNTLTTVPDISDTTISSGEITDALDFEFAEDPYANFWLELTTGLSGALTNNVRSIDIQFRNKIYKIELDKFAIQVPEFLKSFLAILSTVFIFWKMIKYWKIIIDNITSGNMDEVLEMNEEEGITDLF